MVNRRQKWDPCTQELYKQGCFGTYTIVVHNQNPTRKGRQCNICLWLHMLSKCHKNDKARQLFCLPTVMSMWHTYLYITEGQMAWILLPVTGWVEYNCKIRHTRIKYEKKVLRVMVNNSTNINKATITSHLKSSNINKDRYMTLEIQVLDWNRHKNVAEWNWLMRYHPPSFIMLSQLCLASKFWRPLTSVYANMYCKLYP